MSSTPRATGPGAIVTAVFWAVIFAVYLCTIGWLHGAWYLGARIAERISFYRKLGRALAPTTRCPRGHRVSQYGVYRCGCGMTTESWAWRCRCGDWSGYLTCPQCGLAVRNALFE